jgi:hypothetical protein
MDNNQSATVGSIQNVSEQVQKVTEPFRNVLQDSESFGTLPQKEKTEKHTLTVRQATRLFENAGVARTDRSIVNWCNANKHGISRLDCYFEPNERKYFITKESIDRAIEEELAKANLTGQAEALPESNNDVPHASEKLKSFPHVAEPIDPKQAESINALKKELFETQVLAKAKDYFIEQLQKDRENIEKEKRSLVRELVEKVERVGRLSEKLRIEAPKQYAHAATIEEPKEATWSASTQDKLDISFAVSGVSENASIGGLC